MPPLPLSIHHNLKSISSSIPMNKNTLDRLYEYVDVVQNLENESNARLDPDGVLPPRTVDVKIGRKYAKVFVDTRNDLRVHTFVDMNTGDILKAATWQAPAPRGVRGNIYADDYGESCINAHGARYKYNYGS